MGTFEDLTDWVDLHPDDHEQRWRLAKKLYKNSEYEPALEHLLILKARWQPRLNVTRYLAATHYRLGRFPEAIAVLEQGAEDWPDEIPLREQLARVLEVAGRKEGAATIWREIAKLRPGHAMAEQALARLPRLTPSPKEAPTLHDNDLGLNFGSGQTCMNCGALNTEEHDYCWKCAAPLFSTPYTTPTPRPRRHSISSSSDSAADAGDVQNTVAIWNVVGVVAICVALAVATFITLRQLSASYETTVPHTVQQFCSTQLLLTRVVIGLGLLAGWPVALWVALTVCRVSNFHLKPIVITGLLLATMTYVSLSGRVSYLGFHLAFMLALSLVPVLLLFNIEPARSLAVWAVQVVLVGAVGLIAFGAVEGPGAIHEFSVVMRHAAAHDAAAKPGQTPLPKIHLPAQIPLRWEPTGSLWFDDRAGTVEFSFLNSTTSKSIRVSLVDEYGIKSHEESTATPFRFQVKIVPGRSYTLNIDGTPEATVEGMINGVIKPSFKR